MSFPFFRILICIFIFSVMLYAYVESRNHLTEVRLRIPILERELRALQEENIRLQYEIERFESPIHLMELSRMPEFGHLRHPQLNEIVIIPKREEK